MEPEAREYLTGGFVDELVQEVHHRANRSRAFASALQRSAAELATILPTLEQYAHPMTDRSPSLGGGETTLPDFGRTAERKDCQICVRDRAGNERCTRAPCGVVVLIVIIVTRRNVNM